MDGKLTISNNFNDCAYVRTKVFIEEQGFDKEMEFDEIDGYATHIALYRNGDLIGCGRLYEVDENIYRLGRIAILKEYRNEGFGRYLLGVMEKMARDKGARHLIIQGQVSAKGFYDKTGYKVIGDIELEEGVPSIYMRKNVK